MTSPASNRHQDLVRFLVSILGIYVEAHGLGVVRPAPFQMKLEPSGREPDLLFVAKAHEDRLRTSYLDGPADLVVEIISLESVERDRGTKFVEYEAAGIPEYWLIDPLRNWAEFYQLDHEGRYNTAFAGRQGTYTSSRLPDFCLHVDWLWQMPLPPVLDVLRELHLID
jgi:Uma2 family endonuclease